MKALFLAGGRRVSLAERFIDHGFDLYAYETEVDCPISTIATVLQGKKWTDKEIEQHLLETIRVLEIDLIIPLADAATSLLARLVNQNSDLKNKLPSGSETANNICLNKKLFERELQDQPFYPGFKRDCEEVILKPIFGANSKGIKVVHKNTYIMDKNYYDEHFVVQRYIRSGVELSVDAYFNRQGKMVDAVPRQRLEVQGGEVNRSKTLPREVFGVVEITRQVGEKIGLIGPVCAQFILEREKPFIMEINARFGGGVILSLEAGLDIVGMIKREYLANDTLPVKNYDWKVGLQMTRYFKEHFHG